MTAGPEPIGQVEHIERLGVSPVLRAGAAIFPVMFGLIPFFGVRPLQAGIAIPVGLAMFVAMFVLVGRARVRLLPDAVVLTSLVRREIIPWADIDTIESMRVFGQNRAVIATADGAWRCPGLVTPNSRFRFPIVATQVDLLRASWFAAGGGQRAANPPRPWGPDPATFDRVQLRPVGLQAACVNSSGYFSLGYPVFLLCSALMHGLWPFVLGLVGLGAAIAGVSARRRVVLTPAGIESRWLTTTAVPWSAIYAINIASGRWHPARRGQPASVMGPVRVRLITSAGPIVLPYPLEDPWVPDPRFNRKLEFIQRCWEAHRGAAWTAPPPPPGWPSGWLPPPPAP